ncbi:MAG: hypothetical protein HY851_11255 [candidate division Zixibacteria bacterium]|nr:hypothetical protein [candidate division Zixibacteria bacterium]
MKKVSVRLIWGGMVLLWAAAAQAQWHDPYDKGSTDTVDMVVAVIPRAATGQLKVRLDLYAFNDSSTVGAAAAGFGWINPNLKMDSARFSTLAFDAFDFAHFTYEGNSINLTNTNKRFPFVGARSSATGVLPEPSRRLWCRYYFSLSSWTVNDSIILDTNTYNNGVTFKFVDDSLKSYRPWWTGRKIIHDVDYVPPSVLDVIPDTLAFSMVYGASAPPSQTFSITATPNSVPFTVSENSSWILKSPALGNTPATITVSINPTALPIGSYFDSLIIESNKAINSPQIVYAKLAITPPPPQISVSPSQLFFSGVVGGANPIPKSLVVKNGNPGSTLNWTLTHAQPWLSVTPSSGTDSTSVSASVDITGLTYGTYKDTIVVSDPTAVNNPVKVPVILQMGSNLPIIAADSQYNFFVVNLSELILFSRFVTIRNAGAGQLDFRASENATRILGLVPDTGSTPQKIEVRYKMSSAHDGMQVTDTIWITSAQAINSPFPVVITLRFVEFPAVIGLSDDTIKFNVYECSQGFGKSLPFKTLSVQNSGGDDPMAVRLVYASDLFTINKDSAVAPATFRLTALDPDLVPGTYYDSIWVISRNAINNPRLIVVQYNRIGGTETPEIVLGRGPTIVAYQEDIGPQGVGILPIDNKYGGCMPWTLSHQASWLQLRADSGDVPADVGILVDAPGYTLGTYYDTIRVSSAGATNSPALVPVELRVWRFRCDVDWDGWMDISDVTALIEYLYMGGLPAKPTFLVGDCDCDNLVDISDLTRLIDYVFMMGPVICGNPY